MYNKIEHERKKERKKTPRDNWYRTPDSNFPGLINNTLIPSARQQPINNQSEFYVNDTSLHTFDVKQLKIRFKKTFVLLLTGLK